MLFKRSREPESRTYRFYYLAQRNKYSQADVDVLRAIHWISKLEKIGTAELRVILLAH